MSQYFKLEQPELKSDWDFMFQVTGKECLCGEKLVVLNQMIICPCCGYYLVFGG